MGGSPTVSFSLDAARPGESCGGSSLLVYSRSMSQGVPSRNTPRASISMLHVRGGMRATRLPALGLGGRTGSVLLAFIGVSSDLGRWRLC